MELNTDKCKILTVTNKKNIIKHQYKMDKSKLKNVEQEKYIGVIIKKRLSWLPYAKMISCRANLKRQFCKEILEHVIDIFNFNVTRPMLDLLLNTHLQFGIPTIKMSPKRLKEFKEKQPDLF